MTNWGYTGGRIYFVWQIFLQLIGFFLPWPVRRLLYVTFIPSWQISMTARVSRFSLILASRVRIKANAVVKPFIYIGSMRLVYLDLGASLGIVNYVSGSYSSAKSHNLRHGCMRLGRNASITSMHRIDCSGGFSLGSMSILAGYFTQVLTHSINIYSCRQEYSPVRIGRYSFIGTRSTILPGAYIHDFVIVAASALVPARACIDSYCLAVGIPAIVKKSLSPETSFFKRVNGYVL